MTTADPQTTQHGSDEESHEGHHIEGSLAKLTVGAVGVVFGDIGTSPLYAVKETFRGHHPLPVDQLHVFGVLSLIFWSLMLIVTFKYVLLVTRADNKGEGGSMALLALITRKTGGGKRSGLLVMLAVTATALFFGDAMITPAMSVLSAVEGLTVVDARFGSMVLPIAVAILVGLFMVQSRGTEAISKFFGPIVLLYFATLSVLGIIQLVQHPQVLAALSPLSPLSPLSSPSSALAPSTAAITLANQSARLFALYKLAGGRSDTACSRLRIASLAHTSIRRSSECRNVISLQPTRA
jgi:KUP system potassium uptake protein